MNWIILIYMIIASIVLSLGIGMAWGGLLIEIQKLEKLITDNRNVSPEETVIQDGDKDVSIQ